MRRKILAGNVSFMMKEKKSLLLMLWRKSFMTERERERERERYSIVDQDTERKFD